MANTKFEKKLRTCPRTCKRDGQGHVPDINNNDNNNYIYLYLFNIYISKVQNCNFEEKRLVMSELTKNTDYQALEPKIQTKLFAELMSANSLNKKGQETYEK